jgi:hypothetical protein
MLLGVEPPSTLCIPVSTFAVHTGNHPMRSDSACKQRHTGTGVVRTVACPLLQLAVYNG